MIPPASSTKTGFVQPHSRMLAAICATCASLCVRALRAYGMSPLIARRSTLSAGHFCISDSENCRAVVRKMSGLFWPIVAVYGESGPSAFRKRRSKFFRPPPRSMSSGRLQSSQQFEARPFVLLLFNWIAVRTNAWSTCTLTEVLSCLTVMTLSAQTLDVAVVVAATTHQRYDMVGHGGCCHMSVGGAVSTQGLGP